MPSVLQFLIGVNDIGGTLVVELGVNDGRTGEDGRCFALEQNVNLVLVYVSIKIQIYKYLNLLLAYVGLGKLLFKSVAASNWDKGHQLISLQLLTASSLTSI